VSRDENSDPETRTFVLRTEDAEHTLIVHQQIVARDAEDVIYIAIFEAPSSEWEAAWSHFGAQMMDALFEGVGGEC